MVLTAAGGMVTNGSLADTFGSAPFSSVAGAPLSLSDAATGLTDFAPTLSSMTSGLAAISGSGAPLDGLGPTLGAISNAGFTDSMIGAFNSIPSDLGNDGGLFDAIAGFAPQVNDLLTDVTGGSGVLNDALKYAGDWSAQTLGGTFEGIGGNVIGDPKKFGTILNTASSYVTSGNQMINAATNSTALGTTFTGMNNIVSGGVAGVNLDLGGLGTDVAKLGSAVNFDALENLGSPGQLLSNMSSQGTLGPMYEKIASIPVDSRTAQSLGVNSVQIDGVATIGDLGIDLNSVAKQGANLPPNLQKEIYQSLETLDDTEVSQIKAILGTSQESITAGSDLLDPKKLFPSSYETFTAPLRTASVGFRAIYQNSSGSVNGEFQELGNKLKGVVPDDLAVANGALARSLGQVKNIGQTNSEDLGNSLNNLETLKDLDLVETQPEYVDESVRSYWTENYGIDTTYNITLATGKGGQLKTSDVVGFAAGYNSAAPLTKNAQLLAEMAEAGELTRITGNKGIYDTIQKFANGDFGPTQDEPADPFEVDIPAGYVGEGTYEADTAIEAQEDAWLNGIIPEVKTILASYKTNTRGAQIIANSNRWNEQLAREYLNQSRADNTDLTAVRASDDVAINLALNLPNLGRDTSEGGTAEILERVVDFSSLGGQCTIASMREGRNLQRLADANIQNDAPIDTTGLSDPANLVTSTYTAQQAKDQLIKS